ncbi:hypothetical protein J7L06_10020 [Candidatus Bathyarchaeota archaeon]|nr:hypothetical protein [Candidatus Bathyarchaeota archaeon]
MIYDVTLPIYLFSVSLLATILSLRYSYKFEAFFGKREFKRSETVILVLAMGVAVALIVFIPSLAILVLVLSANSLLQFLLIYTVTENKLLAALLPPIFLSSYFFFWNDISLNLFALLAVLSLSLLSGTLFTWNTTVLFAALLTSMDVFHVFVTKFMVVSGERLIAMRLPVVVVMPTFPLEGRIVLGLGDVFLLCLLTIQTAKRSGLKAGVISAATISLVFLIAESMLLTFRVGFFPATTIISVGWVLSIILNYVVGNKKEGRGGQLSYQRR